MELREGQRVRPSLKGTAVGPQRGRCKTGRGTIVGFHNGHPRVLWDGYKTAISYSTVFIEPVTQMSALFTPRSISQRYLRRYGDTARARAWKGRMVHIRTENGLWRYEGAGYTTAERGDAWVLPFEKAVEQISHCGPEKRGWFILADGGPDIS